MRLGLCCKFAREPIRFRTTTAAALLRLQPPARARRLAEICRSNAAATEAAIRFCAGHGIGAFRVGSDVLPVHTHPQTRYEVRDLPDGEAIVAAFRACGRLARKTGVRLLFHPDQFIVLSSADPEITRRAAADLVAQAEIAGWLGADVINIHAGGGYGDKAGALARVARNIHRLPAAVRRRLTLENDERTYTPADLLPFCEAHGIPMVYDVHHHRCLPDGLSIEEVTRRAIATWKNREPVLHVSSPRDGWRGPRPSRHHDYIAAADFPACWRNIAATIEVEAKAKELAVARLQIALRGSAPTVLRIGYRAAGQRSHSLAHL
jgi:UV DNA damage endonuclease